MDNLNFHAAMITATDDVAKKRYRDYGRDSSVERDRNRDKGWERKRSRKQSKRARERSWSRSSHSSSSSNGSWSRPHKQSRRRRSRHGGQQSFSEEAAGSRDNSPFNHPAGQERARSKWNDSSPNNVLLVRNLSSCLREDEIRDEFARQGTGVREVRLMRSRETGESLRYCFVEFFCVDDAQDWMTSNQGEMRVEDGRTWYMYYSTTRRGNIAPVASALESSDDWLCTKCSCGNFQRRTFCRRCSHAREETTRRVPYSVSSLTDGSDQVGPNPCNTLILRGLDGLTTEESISSAIFQHSAIQTQQCHVVRDVQTGASSGFALVEFLSAREGRAALSLLTPHHNPLEVDGKALLVHYAKNNFNTAIATLTQAPPVPITSHQSFPVLTMPTKPTDFTENAAAAVAQAAMQKRRPTNSHNYNHTYYPNKHPTTSASPTTTNNNTYPKYPVPDTSKFTFDEASGYHFDPSTSFYYDAKSQYFYNAAKQHFMYWHAEQRTYIPVSNHQATTTSAAATTTTSAAATTTSATSLAASTTATSAVTPNPANEKAKRIAKDMERWARRMNSQKDAIKTTNPSITQVTNPPITQVTIPSINNSLNEVNKPQKNHKQSTTTNMQQFDEVYCRHEQSSDELPAPTQQSFSMPLDDTPFLQATPLTATLATPLPTHSASTTASSFETPGCFRSEEEMVEWGSLTCLLCKRAFLSRDTLLKHLQLSSLHKKNLADYTTQYGSFEDETQAYRDRASERRKKFGQPATTPKPSPKALPTMKAHECIAAREDEETVGSRLMERMGWKHGQGLGKELQGIVTPVQATMRGSLAGLGSRVVESQVDGQNNYNDRLKNSFRAYFNDIQ